MFTEVFPIISTTNLPRALTFYRDALDGRIAYRFPDEGEPQYVSLTVGSSQLGLAHDDSEESHGGLQRMALWVYAENCDAAVERLRLNGAEVVEPPADQPWGERVARLRDPDGNMVIIGAAVP